jgi:signal transduction histidine kinase
VTVPGPLRARLALRAGLFAALAFAAVAAILEFTLVRPLGEAVLEDLQAKGDLMAVQEARGRRWEARLLIAVSAVGGAALVAAGAAAAAGLVLEPLRGMTEAARRGDAGTADLRLPDRGGGEEFDDLARLLNDLLARVGAAMEEERRFAGEAAHELRAPLSVLRLRVEEALADGDAASMRTALDSALADVDRVERLVQALLELSRAATGASSRPTGPAEPIDAAAVLAPLAEDLRTLASARGLGLDWRPPAGPLRVAVPREVVETTVSVLVDNALRYTPKGGEVVVEAVPEAGAVRLRVSDSGPGIPWEEAEKVFDRLYRGKAGRASGAGFGLGLPLARRLARSAGGDVVLENPGEPGARFAVLLPAA